jgi:hypothetical protein
MKLLVISSAFPPMRVPESAHTLELCTRLHAAGPSVELVTGSGADDGATPVTFPVHRVMAGWGWRDLRRLMSVIGRVKPDVVLLIYLGMMYDHPTTIR